MRDSNQRNMTNLSLMSENQRSVNMFGNSSTIVASRKLTIYLVINENEELIALIRTRQGQNITGFNDENSS